MKKGTFLGIFLSIICILLLLSLGAFIMLDFKNMVDLTAASNNIASIFSETEAPSSMENEPNIKLVKTDLPEEEDAQTVVSQDTIPETEAPLPEHHIIFVGDSRTVGMGEAEMEKEDTCVYVGAVGEGYNWFEETGLSQMEKAMEQYPDSPVILNLGVNDPDAIPQYLELYQTFEERYPEHTFYFMSVNPVTDKCESRTNMEISDFNTQLKEAFPDQYLDCYTYLLIREFESADGVHYSDDTYCMIHDYVVKMIVN